MKYWYQDITKVIALLVATVMAFIFATVFVIPSINKSIEEYKYNKDRERFHKFNNLLWGDKIPEKGSPNW